MLFHENSKVYYYDMETNKIAIRNIENMPSEGAEKTNKIAGKYSRDFFSRHPGSATCGFLL